MLDPVLANEAYIKALDRLNRLMIEADALIAVKQTDEDLLPIIADYQNEIADATDSVYRGEITKDQFDQRVRDALIAFALLAYLMGSGMTENDLEDSDRQRIADWVDEQTGYVDGLSAAVLDAKKNEAKREGIASRIVLWGGTLAAFGMMSHALTATDRVGKWIYGDTIEHCATCQMLSNGPAHRVSWYIQNGFIPREAGSATLECNGYRCQCEVRDTRTGERLL